MFETAEKLEKVLAMLERVALSGSANMLNFVTAVATLNDVIKELRGENDVQTE